MMTETLTTRQKRLRPFYDSRNVPLFGPQDYTILAPTPNSVLLSDENETVASVLFGDNFDGKLRSFVIMFWFPAMIFQLVTFPIGLMTIIDKFPPHMAIISILGAMFPSLLLLRSHFRVIQTLLRRWESLFLTFYSIIFCTCVTLLVDNFFKSLFIWVAVLPALLASTFTDASAVRLDSAFLKGNLSVIVLTVPPYIISLAYVFSIVVLINTRNTVGPKNTTIYFSSTVTTSNINYGNIASSSGLTICLFVVKSLTVLFRDSSRCVTLDAAMNIDIITLNKPIRHTVSDMKTYLSRVSPSGFHLKSKMNSVGVDPGDAAPLVNGQCIDAHSPLPVGSDHYEGQLMKALKASSADINSNIGASKADENNEMECSEDDDDDEQRVLEAVFMLSGATGLVPIRNLVTQRPFMKSLLFRSLTNQSQKIGDTTMVPRSQAENSVAHPVNLSPNTTSSTLGPPDGYGLRVSSAVVNMTRRPTVQPVRRVSRMLLDFPAYLKGDDGIDTDKKRRCVSVDFGSESFSSPIVRNVNHFQPSEDLEAQRRNSDFPHSTVPTLSAGTAHHSINGLVTNVHADGTCRVNNRVQGGVCASGTTASAKSAFATPGDENSSVHRVASTDQISCPTIVKSSSTQRDGALGVILKKSVAIVHFDETNDDPPPSDGIERNKSVNGIDVTADKDTPTPAPMTARQKRLLPFYVRADATIFGANEYTLISPTSSSILISDESETVAMRLFGESFDLKLRVFVTYFWYPALIFQLGCLPIGLLTLLGGLPSKGAYVTIPGAIFPMTVLLQCHWKIFIQLLHNWEQIFLTLYSAIFCISLSLITTGTTRVFYIWLVIFPSLISSAFSDASSTRLDNTFLNKHQKKSMVQSVFLFALPPYVASLSYIFSIVAMLNLKFDVVFDFASSLPMRNTVLNANVNYSITACSTGFTITLFLLKCLFFLCAQPNQCVSLRSPMAVHIAILEPAPTNVEEREAGYHVLEARFAIQRGGDVVAGYENNGNVEKETIGEPKRIHFRCRNLKEMNVENSIDWRDQEKGKGKGDP
jgi:hypothetical protein